MTALRAIGGERVGAPARSRPLAAARTALVAGVVVASAALAAWLHASGVLAFGPAVTAYRASVLASTAPALAPIGFDVPPLPVLLALPAAAMPAFRWTALAPAVVASLAAALAVWSLAGALGGLGVRPRAALAVAAAVAVQPLWVFAAATGSSQLIAAALLVAGARGIMAWLRTGDVLGLVGSSFALGAASLVRYDLALLGIALAAVIGLAAAKDGADVRARALAIGYVTPVAGTLGLWIVVVALATGDLLGLPGRSQAALGLPADGTPSLAEPLLAVGAMALAAAALWTWRDRVALVLLTMVAGVAVPPLALAVVTRVPMTLDDLIPVVPLVALLAARPRMGRARLALGAAAVILAAGSVAAMALAEDRALGHREAVAAAQGAADPMWAGERVIAEAIRGPEVTRVLVDDRADVIVALLAAAPERVVGVGHPLEAEALRSPATAVDHVLVRTPSGRGSGHRVARALPTLYDGGLGWDLVADRPVSGEAAEYRLYRSEGRVAP